MRNEELLEDSIRDAIMEICATLYRHGIRAVPIGAMMRLMGVEQNCARDHDAEFFALDEEFVKMAQHMKYLDREFPNRPPDSTLH